MELFALLGVILNVVASMFTNTMNINNANEQLENQQNFAHSEAELANERALENYEKTQSPESRLQQFKNAGLSPGLMYGGTGTGGGVTVTSQASAPGANLPVMQNPFANGMNDLFENLKKIGETENISQDTEKKKQEIDNLKSEIEVNNATIEKISTENNLTDVLTANAKIDGVIKEIEAEIAQTTKQNRIEIVATQLKNMQNEGEKLLKEIEGLKIDNDNKQRIYDATINKIAAEINLLYKQAIKTEAETMLTKATTALTTEQTNLTFAQRQKCYKEIQQFKFINAKIEAETKLMDQETSLKKMQKVTEIIGWIENGSKILNQISSTLLKAAIITK